VTGRRTVLVTGGAGFIGSHIVDRLLADGRSVHVIDDLSTGSVKNLPSSVALDEVDLAGADASDHVARVRPSVIVHCAAQTSVTASFRDPVRDARSNIIASLNVIGGAQEAGTERFIYVTTGGALYGQPIALPCTEDHPVAPLSPYGWSKWLVERYLDVLLTGHMDWTALRLANVYGPRQRADGEAGVVAIFADRMRRGLPVVVYGDGEQTRDFLFAPDVAAAVSVALTVPGSAVLNIGTGRAVSVNRLFAELAAILEYKQAPIHEAQRPGEIRHSVLDASRAELNLGWAAETSLEDGLRQTCQALLAAAATVSSASQESGQLA
jgi:UDP-glucose 4-epimerase